MSAAVLNRLLRTPGEIAADCREDRDMRSIAATSLSALALGAAVFGGVIGSYRGGVQIFYGAVKVPLAMMATLAFCVPAFHAIAAGLGRAFPIRTIVALVLAAAGRAALVLFALAPLLWLAFDRGVDYHRAVLLSSFAYAGAGLAAFSVLVRGLGKGQHRMLTAIAFAGVFFAVGGQASWILRPYLIRPRTWEAAEHHAQRIPFVRGYEGTFVDSLFQSGRSAMIYNGSEVRDDIDERANVNEGDLRVPPRDPSSPSDVRIDVPALRGGPNEDQPGRAHDGTNGEQPGRVHDGTNGDQPGRAEEEGSR